MKTLESAQHTLPVGSSARRGATGGHRYMSDPHLEAVPLPPSTDLAPEAPDISPALDPLPGPAVYTAMAPLVEPMDTFGPRLERVARIPAPTPPELATSLAPLPKRVSHRQFQTTLDVSQGIPRRESPDDQNQGVPGPKKRLARNARNPERQNGLPVQDSSGATFAMGGNKMLLTGVPPRPLALLGLLTLLLAHAGKLYAQPDPNSVNLSVFTSPIDVTGLPLRAPGSRGSGGRPAGSLKE